MNYFDEQQEWLNIVRDVVGPDATLLSVSINSSDARVYSKGSQVYKIRRLTPASMRWRRNTLADEAVVLRRLACLAGVPKYVSYSRTHEWEVLVQTAVPRLRGFDPTFGPKKERLDSFASLCRAVFAMNMLGCSHGDLTNTNAGVNVEGTISMMDFDQACFDRSIRCFCRDFFGLNAGGHPSMHSLFRRARHVQFVWMVPLLLNALKRGIDWLSRVAAKVRHASSERARNASTDFVEYVKIEADPQLDRLAFAWQSAARSSASSPGKMLAYYSLDVSGINFPGERPWVLRWSMIERVINFKGKRFLELGCNMGLLAIHAALSGAERCTAIDADADILSAGRVAAEVFGADVEYQNVDLDANSDWEEPLRGHDCIAALSVVHWIKDKERLWRFISTHSEVLYESHESEEQARETLATAGFSRVVSIGETERARPMLFASR